MNRWWLRDMKGVAWKAEYARLERVKRRRRIFAKRRLAFVASVDLSLEVVQAGADCGVKLLYRSQRSEEALIGTLRTVGKREVGPQASVLVERDGHT